MLRANFPVSKPGLCLPSSSCLSKENLLLSGALDKIATLPQAQPDLRSSHYNKLLNLWMRWATERRVLRVWIGGRGGGAQPNFHARRALRLAAASLYVLVTIAVQALYKDGAAKITKDLRRHGLLPESVVFLSPSQAGDFSGIQGSVRSVANQMESETGERPTLTAAASELGRRANQGSVRSVANQMKEKTGVLPTLTAAASELGSRGNQGSVCSVAMQMKFKTGKMPTLEAAASEMASIFGRKGVGKPKGNAVWAKVVQIPGFDEEILGTEKCADTKAKICAELCHQGIGLLFTNCKTKYIGKWFKYAGEPLIIRPS